MLLLFNERDSCAFADMNRLTGMEDKDLRLTLLSLSMGKPVRATRGGCVGVCVVLVTGAAGHSRAEENASGSECGR